MCLFSWDYAINHNKNGDENGKEINRYDIKVLGLGVDTNIVNVKSVSSRWYLMY